MNFVVWKFHCIRIKPCRYEYRSPTSVLHRIIDIRCSSLLKYFFSVLDVIVIIREFSTPRSRVYGPSVPALKKHTLCVRVLRVCVWRTARCGRKRMRAWEWQRCPAPRVASRDTRRTIQTKSTARRPTLLHPLHPPRLRATRLLNGRVAVIMNILPCEFGSGAAGINNSADEDESLLFECYCNKKKKNTHTLASKFSGNRKKKKRKRKAHQFADTVVIWVYGADTLTNYLPNRTRDVFLCVQ